LEEMTEDEKKLNGLFAHIPLNGKPIGNISLLKRSGLTDDDYWRLRNKLLDEGRIGKGKGKGGSVYRLVESTSALKKT
jgi:adenine-specific DNA-methyltransferase